MYIWVLAWLREWTWLGTAREWRKDVQKGGHTEKLEMDGLTLIWRSFSTSDISVFLLYSWIERKLIIYRWSSRRGYCTQVNKEPGCIANSWIKETGLANLRMSDLCRGAVFRLWVSERENYGGRFQHTPSTFLLRPQREASLSLCAFPKGKSFAIPWGLRL